MVSAPTSQSPVPSSREDDLFSFPLLQTIRRLEWAAIVIIIAIDFWRRFVAQNITGTEIWMPFVLFLISLGTLSWMYRANMSKWHPLKRVAWLLMQLALVFLASIFSACGPLFFLNVFIAAKTVLLVDLKAAAVVIVLNSVMLGSILLVATDVLNSRGVEGSLRWTEIGLQLVLFTLVNVIVVFIANATVCEARTRRRIEELAIENEVLTKEIERSRIARDLHDTLGHTLVSLGIQLEVMDEFRTIDPEKTTKALKTARQLTDSLITDVRRTVQAIRDPNFDLDNSLQELVQQVRGNDKLAVELNVDVKRLPNRLGDQLFCIAKECLTNVQKHAKASNVTLTIQQKFDHVELCIADDGCGFQPTDKTPGCGLSNIQERVRIMAGNLSLNSAPNQGTQIKVSIPV